MKLSIWQQFSSNHSANFTVVATFESLADAQRAEQAMRELLLDLGSYYSANPDTLLITPNTGMPLPLRPSEIELAQQYQIPLNEWTITGGGIDWIRSTEDAAEALHVIDRFLFVENPCDTWLGSSPVDRLLKRMGGIVAIGGDYDGYIGINLSCKAPNLAIAVEIEDQLNKALRAWEDSTDDADPRFPELTRGKVSRTENLLNLYALRLFSPIWEELEHLIEALASFGCTEIQYEFGQGDYDASQTME